VRESKPQSASLSQRLFKPCNAKAQFLPAGSRFFCEPAMSRALTTGLVHAAVVRNDHCRRSLSGDSPEDHRKSNANMKCHSMAYHLINILDIACRVIAVRMNQWKKGTPPSVKDWAKRDRRPTNSEGQPGEREFCFVTREGGLWDIVPHVCRPVVAFLYNNY
jgi:hypothetical protein